MIIAVDQQLGDPGKFDLAIDGEGGYDKTLENAVNGSSTSLVVPGGPVAFSEAAGDDTDMSDYTSAYECVNSAEGSEDAPVSGQGTDISSLPVKPGDVWTCTFTNTRKGGHVKLVKDIVPVNEQLGDPGKFDLNIDGEGAYDATKPTPATATSSSAACRTATSTSARPPARRYRTSATTTAPTAA